MTHAGTSNQLLLSVAILVRDEANVIADTIENVAPIADEIVVIDTGSTDRTVAIARRTGARVVEIPWTDDFSAARNAAWQHLAGEWVLWIDADERLTAGSLDQIRPFLQRQPAGVAAHVVMVAVPPAAPGNIGEEAGRIRLVRRSANVQFEGRVVESLKPALNRADLGIMLSDIRLTRSIREHDAELKARRAQRNQRLIDLETAERGVSPRLLQAAGEIQATCGRRQAAIELFRQAIDMAEAGSTEMLEAYYGLLTSLGEQSDDHDRLLAVGLEALEVFPLDSHLLCLMGSHLETQDRHETAEQSFRVAHQFGQIDPFTWHVREIGEIVAVCLATSIESKGEIDEAITVLNEAAKRFGDSQRIWRRLLELQIKIANHEEALAVVDRMRLTPSEQGALRSAVRGSCLAVRENWIPALAQLRAAHEAGCRDAICLRWYSVALLANGQAEAAEPVLVEWQQIEPENAAIGTYLMSLRSAIKIGHDARNEHNAHVTVTVPTLGLLVDAPRTAPPMPAPTTGTTHAAASSRTNHRALALFKQAVALVERADWDAALARFGEARTAGYAGPGLHQHVAGCLTATGRREEAEMVLCEWIDLDPTCQTAQEALAELLQQTGQRPGSSRPVIAAATPLTSATRPVVVTAPSAPHTQPARPHIPSQAGVPAMHIPHGTPPTDPARA
jgi:tetratricopeptide (TPR) repeat protein